MRLALLQLQQLRFLASNSSPESSTRAARHAAGSSWAPRIRSYFGISVVAAGAVGRLCTVHADAVALAQPVDEENLGGRRRDHQARCGRRRRDTGSRSPASRPHRPARCRRSCGSCRHSPVLVHRQVNEKRPPDPAGASLDDVLKNRRGRRTTRSGSFLPISPDTWPDPPGSATGRHPPRPPAGR